MTDYTSHSPSCLEPIREKLIVGLGNPGPNFEHTYHNVGFLAIDTMASNNESQDASVWKNHRAVFSFFRTENHIFIKPLTFMNESGLAVKEALKKFALTVDDLLVIHDESDLSVGDVRRSIEKNAAGHRGVQSIIDHIHTNAFPRIRIGIRPVHESTRKKAGAFVLAKITSEDRETFQKVFEEIKQALAVKP